MLPAHMRAGEQMKCRVVVTQVRRDISALYNIAEEGTGGALWQPAYFYELCEFAKWSLRARGFSSLSSCTFCLSKPSRFEPKDTYHGSDEGKGQESAGEEGNQGKDK